MGFTALDGLPMGTRPGQLDPGVVLYLLDRRGHERGGGDAASLPRGRASRGSPASATTCATCSRATTRRRAFAIDHFVHRIGADGGLLAAALGGLDGFVFTAGIGENSRADPRAHRRSGSAGSALSSTRRPMRRAAPLHLDAARAASPCYVIPTDEELMIARHTLALVSAARLTGRRPDDGLSRFSAVKAKLSMAAGPRRRYRQRALDRLGLRPRLPRARRRARRHLPEREGEALCRAAWPRRARGADLHAARLAVPRARSRRSSTGSARNGAASTSWSTRSPSRRSDAAAAASPMRRARASSRRWTSPAGPSSAWRTSPSR